MKKKRNKKIKEKNPEMPSNLRQEIDRSIDKSSDAFEYQTDWETVVDDHWMTVCFHIQEHLKEGEDISDF